MVHTRGPAAVRTRLLPSQPLTSGGAAASADGPQAGAGQPSPRSYARSRRPDAPALSASPPSTSTAPSACHDPNGLPNASTPAATPTTGSRLTNAPASSADTRACPYA